MRFLCLHGAGTNAEIFKLQLAPLIYALQGERHDFEFVEGNFPCPAAEGIEATFPEQSSFFQYFDPARSETVLHAVEQLHSLLTTEDPPFGGLIGFSQGAMLGATILLDQSRDQSGRRSPALKCAVLMCSPLPVDTEQKCRLGVGHHLQDVIRIPTFHVFGVQDQYYRESVELSRLCDQTAQHTHDHGGGHEIPNKPAFTEILAEGLRKCVLTAHTRQ